MRPLTMLVLLATSTAGCGAPLCPGTPGEDWVQGEVTVAFIDSVTEARAQEVLSLEAVAFREFLSTQGRVRAIADVAVGEECSTAARLDAHPEIEDATVSWLLHP